MRSVLLQWCFLIWSRILLLFTLLIFYFCFSFLLFLLLVLLSGLLCCLTSSLCTWMRFDFILLNELIRWLIRIRASIVSNHTLICFEWLIIVILVAIIMNNNTLIHSDTHIRIESSHVLQIVHLTLEQSKVISKHLPVKLLSDELVPLVLFIF